ncbi:MAG: polysaccharide biosynthesis tyrosine autokinase [Gemmatimonadetes bacterium]|nr:polysaccharide biosynthesis tyrosine autokinase [Gemmatimonadota bacterium]
MNPEAALRPYGEYEPEAQASGGHLTDYWQVVARRLWLVLLIFSVTTASAVWAVSRQRTYYQAHLAFQINDPMQRTRSLTPGARFSGMEIFVDPIQSEIQVLRSAPVANKVVEALGLRFMPASPDIPRSSLVRDVTVAPDTPDGDYVLAYDAAGRMAQFRSAGGTVLGSAPVGSVIEAAGLRFTLQPPPGESREYPLLLRPREQAAQIVRGQTSATPRENTNIVDATYTSTDPVLAPKIMNATAEALRNYGAERVKVAASAEVRFIEEQLTTAREQLHGSLERIQDFKKSQAFTNLSAEEQALVERGEQLRRQIEELDGERSSFSRLTQEIERGGLAETDLAKLTAQIGASSNPSIGASVDRIRGLQEDRLKVLTSGSKRPDHPEVRAIDEQIRSTERDLVEAIRGHVQNLTRRLEEPSRQLQELEHRQRQFPELESQLQKLELQQSVEQGTYQFILSQLYQAKITEAVASPYVDIIDPAVGASRIGPRGRMNVLLGALLGLLLGVGAAFFLEYLDRTVRTSADVEQLLAIPVLGVIPRLRRVGRDDVGHKPIPLIVALDPLDPAAEAYRNLRMNLTFMRTDDQSIRSLTFSSPGPDEGKSTTALNFAVMLAQQGLRVLLMDADLRRPMLHHALDLLREPGLTNLLIGDASPREALRPNVLPNLDLLPAGPFPPNPSELLNSKTMGRLLEEFEGKYDQVIVDSPPILAVTDAAVLAARTDGLVLVMRSGETEQRGAERAVEQLRRIGVRVLGAVLNGVSTTSSDDSYYLQYYHRYQPQRPKRWTRIRNRLEKVRFW